MQTELHELQRALDRGEPLAETVITAHSLCPRH